MTRPTFFEPQGGLHPETVHDTMSLVCPGSSMPPMAEIERWTPLELLVAYDWAMRECLRASDSIVRRRPRPFFTVRRDRCPSL